MENISESPASKKQSAKVASIGQMLQYCRTGDYLYLLVALLGALVSSFGWPAFTLVNGSIIDAFVQYELKSNETDDRERSAFLRRVFFYSGLQLLDSLFYAMCLVCILYGSQMFALRQVNAYKRHYLQSILRQEIAWFDQGTASGEFASTIASDFKKIENGLNENLGLLIANVAGAIVQLATGLYFGWKLSLVILSLTPVIFGCSAIATKFQTRFLQKESQANSEASSVAEEVISSIRTVYAFNGQAKEQARYRRKLAISLRNALKQSTVSALDNAVKWCTQYASLALTVGYGVKLILNGEEGYTIGRVVIVFWCTSGFGYNVAFATPYIEAFQGARSVAASIFRIIQRTSEIDPSSEKGRKLTNGAFITEIEFRNVQFNYPSREEVSVLNELNLKINSGEIVALVGQSGCGKSTIIQLIQRFYEPSKGNILLDGVNLKELNVGWLRQQIRVVGQEPVLFDESIEENIRLGTPLEQIDSITMEDIIQAAKKANAHDFIVALPDGYQTYVGERGAQLSGGQKQRIAIARALICKPKILLLDEATSALDMQSEHMVQSALDRASCTSTTLIVAHRLSTIRNANRIIFLQSGKVFEEGTHTELMARKGAYYSLVQAQQVQTSLGNTIETNSFINKPENSQPNQAQNDFKIDDGSEGESALLSNTKAPHLRLFKLIWGLSPLSFVVAFTAAIFYGLATPTYALILGSLVGVFGQTTDAHFLWSQTERYIIYFLFLSVAMFVFNILQISLFGYISARLTNKLRALAFSAIIEQNITWFDKKKNSSGALCSRLASDAADVQGLTGLRIAMLCQTVSTLIAAVCIGFYFNWRMSLVALVLMPIVGSAAVLASQLYTGQIRQDGELAERTGKLVIEVVNSVRTVTSLHKQAFFLRRFTQLREEHFTAVQKRVFKKAFVIAISQGMPFFAYAVCYFFGGFLVSQKYLKSGDFFRISESMVFGALVVGRSAIFSADYNKAKLAALNIFKLIDSRPKQKTLQVANFPLARSKGNVSLHNVHFHYPNRADSPILLGLSFSIHKGQKVAIVGGSGCGKSTVVSLLEKFYECTDGEISLDGKNIRNCDSSWLRAQMSLVEQEPVLFGYSIGENIAYGDTSRTVSLEEIVQAAEQANVHTLIQNLPLGYDTPVGPKGRQLSAGEKQRIAIARALIRQGGILLLDEPTSALDSESALLEVLQEASPHRTCILVAHQLKTIVNADKIVVIHEGRNAEEGTHQELMARKGHYWTLYNRTMYNQL